MKIHGRKIQKKPVGTIGPGKNCFEKWGIGTRNVGKRGKRNYMALHARIRFPT
jgi:hypothetical protein